MVHSKLDPSLRQRPYLELLEAILRDLFLVRDVYLAQGVKAHRRIHKQIAIDREWIAGDNANLPFSFPWVCSCLGLDHGQVRLVYLSGRPVYLERHLADMNRVLSWASPLR